MGARRSYRILVVEDHDGVREVVVRALRGAGYEVVALGDGSAAFHAAGTAEQPYDLVITNNHLPHMNGLELIQRLRTTRPELPIVHLDDLSDPALSRVPADVPSLDKPFEIETLLRTVRRLLHPARGREPPGSPTAQGQQGSSGAPPN